MQSAGFVSLAGIHHLLDFTLLSCFCFPSSMVRQILGRPTRSIYLALACLSLTLHLLLAVFCLSVLQTACVLPASSSSSSSSAPRTDTQHHQPVSHTSSSDASSTSHKLPTNPQDIKSYKLSANTSHHEGKDSFNGAIDKGKKLIRAGKVIQKVKGHSKLEALFNHPLYNLPHSELHEDDWLLRVKTNKDVKDTGSEEEETEDAINDDSEWWVTQFEKIDHDVKHKDRLMPGERNLNCSVALLNIWIMH